jgi:signal recognition particle subunit SRP54
MEAGKLGGFDVVMLDTAGRTTVDEALMEEAAQVKRLTNPHEVLLVVDALTGQDAVNTATAFNDRMGVTGIVMTRVDGDGRGGAALSMRAVTGKPIKLIGVGEKVDALEDFHPARIANRILGMGDIVSLVERAAETIDMEEAAAMAAKMQKGKFDLDDMKMQLMQMEKLGGMGGIMGMMPGMGKMKDAMSNAKIDDKMIKRQVAIINSMTPAERRNPDILKHSRKQRIAKGAGAGADEINKVLKMHRGMAEMMKMMQGKGGKGLMGKLGSMMGLGGGMPGGMAMPSPEQMAALQEKMGQGGGLGGSIPGLPKGITPPGGLGGGKLPGLGLPGLGGKSGGGLPGLGGFPFGAGKKK